MNFKFSNLLGATYRSGNVLLHGDGELFSASENRVTILNLRTSQSTTLPFENLHTISLLALSPNGVLLLSVDETGRALLINVRRRVLLHHFSFKSPVTAIEFSPCGEYFAAGVGPHVQVWQSPALTKSFTPFHLLRTFPTCHDEISCILWTRDSQFLAVGSKDLSVRIFSVNPLPSFKPPTLSGFRDKPVALFFPKTQSNDLNPEYSTLYVLSGDGALWVWKFDPEPQNLEESFRPDQGRWSIETKHFFLQGGTTLTAGAFHGGLSLVAAGFSSGVFALYRMPEFDPVQILSLSRERVSTLCFDSSGEWLAAGSLRLAQLLVWEWRSESHLLKHQGHSADVAVLDFSPDGAIIATGGQDAKIKVRFNEPLCSSLLPSFPSFLKSLNP